MCVEKRLFSRRQWAWNRLAMALDTAPTAGVQQMFGQCSHTCNCQNTYRMHSPYNSKDTFFFSTKYSIQAGRNTYFFSEQGYFLTEGALLFQHCCHTIFQGSIYKLSPFLSKTDLTKYSLLSISNFKRMMISPFQSSWNRSK